jgi:hypothetical protein
MLTTEAVIRAGHETVRNCPTCTQLRWDLQQAHRNLVRKWFRTRTLWIRYGALPEDLAVLDARWQGYARRARLAARVDVCQHEPVRVPLTPVRPSYYRSEQPKLGYPGDKGDLVAIRDSALSDLLDLQESAFNWQALNYDLLGDLTEHEETATAFELVSDREAEDRLWIEDLDEEDWRRIHAFCEGEPRWYVESEDPYAPMHFLEKWRLGDTTDDTRDHPARDRLAALRRRHQGAQVMNGLRELYLNSPYRVSSWSAPNSELASSDRHVLDFGDWLENWAPDALADVVHALTLAERPPREPVVMLKPAIKTASWRIYQDEPLSELEVELLKRDARDRYIARFGHRPDNVYVNTNWVEIQIIEGAASELPDELMMPPEEAYAE